jgi:hypothetical protein
MDIPRNPEHYWPSIHAVQQSKDREIPWEQVSETIETGNTHDAYKADCVQFRKHYPDEEYPLNVVANIENGQIVTVMWRE